MSRFRVRSNPLAPPIANATSSPFVGLQQRLRATEVAARSTRMPACYVYRAGALTHTATGAYQAITWDQEAFDNDGMFTAPSSTLTIVTPGIYLVTGKAHMAANGTGVRYIQIWKNGAATATIQTEQTASAAFIAGRQITTTIALVAGDTVALAMFQNSGGNLAYSVNQGWTEMSAVMLSS